MVLLRLVVALVLFTVCAGLPARAEGQRVILVLDSSGSMKGKIGGKAKIDIAKDVVGQIVKGWNPEDELGLVAYGHRSKDSCEDIELLRAPGTLDAAAFMQSVRSMKPLGKTPMTEAVRQAAQALQYSEKKATVILVSDGIENCGADPCAVAEELNKAGVSLKVHTVGFGLDDKGAVAQLKCLAEKTGGTFNTANSASELQKVLTKTVKAEPPPAEKFNFFGHVVMAPGVELPAEYKSASWVFKTAPKADGTQGAYVDTKYQAETKTNLDPGQYVVTVGADNAKINVPFDIMDGKPTRIEASLDAGIVNFSGELAEGQPITDKGTGWTIDGEDGKYLATLYGAAPHTLLNAGDYKVTVALGDAKVSTPFHVDAGKSQDVKAALGAGHLVVSATFSPNGEAVANRMAFEVHMPGNSQGEVGDWINTQYEAQSKFDLPAGKYVAVFTLDLARATQEIEIRPGETQKVVINANAGFIAATADGVTSWEVREGKAGIDGQHKWLSTTYDPALNIAVNAGSYQVRALKGDAVIGEKTVDVQAGARAEVALP